MVTDFEAMIEALDSIMKRTQLAKNNKDYGKLPGLMKEYEDATGS